MLLLALGTLAAMAAATPNTCQPRSQRPYMPIYHIIGESKGVGGWVVGDVASFGTPLAAVGPLSPIRGGGCQAVSAPIFAVHRVPATVALPCVVVLPRCIRSNNYSVRVSRTGTYIPNIETSTY